MNFLGIDQHPSFLGHHTNTVSIQSMNFFLCLVLSSLSYAASVNCEICKEAFSCIASVETFRTSFADSFRACVCPNRDLLAECSKLRCNNEIERRILLNLDVVPVCDSAIPTSTLVLIDLLKFSNEKQMNSARLANQLPILTIALLFIVILLCLTHKIVFYMEHCKCGTHEDLPQYFPKLPRYEDIAFKE